LTNQTTPLIVCVDDEQNLLDTMERTLRSRFIVKSFKKAQAALDFCKSTNNVSVVISDFKMPEMNGIEFLDQIKKIAPNASRVLVSGQIDLKEMEEAINRATVHRFVTKPWDQNQFIIHIIGAFKAHKTMAEKDRYRTLSITDPVTQLTNHRFFQENIRMEWKRHTQNKDQLSLIFIDIDHFKRLNDQYGHPEGDKILSAVAQRMVENIPPGTNLSRYGGEEFALVLPNMNSNKAKEIAEKLRVSVSQSPFEDYRISISLGVSTSPEFANSVDELIIGADQALYQAKRLGRNQTVVGLPLKL